MKKNFRLLSLIHKKKFSIKRKKDAYELIVINKNLLLDKNRRVDKKTDLLLIIT